MSEVVSPYLSSKLEVVRLTDAQKSRLREQGFELVDGKATERNNYIDHLIQNKEANRQRTEKALAKYRKEISEGKIIEED